VATLAGEAFNRVSPKRASVKLRMICALDRCCHHRVARSSPARAQFMKKLTELSKRDSRLLKLDAIACSYLQIHRGKFKN
jgi:hypothetical protein